MPANNKYFAYINKKAEDFLFDFRWLDMISKCFSTVWHFEAVIFFNIPLYIFVGCFLFRFLFFGTLFCFL